MQLAATVQESYDIIQKKDTEILALQNAHTATTSAVMTQQTPASTAAAAQVEELRAQLGAANELNQQAAQYIAHQEAALEAAKAAPHPTTSTSTQELDELKAELEAAAQYVVHQEAIISGHLQTIEALRAGPAPTHAPSPGDSTELEELRAQLQQGSDYCAYLAAQLEAANTQLQQAAEYVAFKESELEALKAAPAPAPAPAASTDEVAALNARLEEATLQLQQGATFVQHQDSQIAALSAELEALKAAPAPADLTSKIDELTAELESVRTQGADWVQHQDAQITALGAELEALKAAPKAPDQSAELEELRGAVQQGAEYVAYQDAQIAALSAELEALKAAPKAPDQSAELEAANATITQAQDYIAYQRDQIATLAADLEAKDVQLKQAAEYCAYQDGQLEAMKEKMVSIETKQAEPPALLELQRRFSASEDKMRKHDEEATAQLARARDEAKALKLQLAAAQAQVEAYAQQALLHEQSVQALTAAAQQSTTGQEELDALNVQLAEGATFVAWQDAQITALGAELEALKAAPKAPDQSAELEELRGAVQQGAEYVAYQDAQIAALSAELEALKAAPAPAPAANTDEVAALNARLEEATLQLQQGATFVQHQDSQIAALSAELEALKAASHAPDPNPKPNPDRLAEVQELRAQLQAGADYVAYLDQTIAALNAEVAALQQAALVSAPSPDPVLAPAPAPAPTLASAPAPAPAGYTEEIEALRAQLQAGADYVAYQDSIIAAHAQEIAALKAASIVAPPSAHPAPYPDAALEKKLIDADTFINHQSIEIARLQQRLGEGQQSTQYIKDLTSAEVQQQLDAEHKKALDALAAEAQGLRDQLRTLEHAHEQSMLMKDTEIALLRDQHAASKAEIEEFIAARAVLAADIDGLTAKLQESHDAAERAEKKVSEAAARTELLSGEKASLLGEITVLQANLDAAKSFAFPTSPAKTPQGMGDDSLIVSSPMSASKPIKSLEMEDFEKEKEHHVEVIVSLIEAKMALAQNSNELDEERGRVTALQRRLAAYSNKITALESRLGEQMEKQERSIFSFARRKKAPADDDGL